MSKAFTREDDSGDAPLPPLVSPLPPGSSNPMTAAGAARLQEELTRLGNERAALVDAARSEAHAAEARDQLRRLDQRALYLQESLRRVEIVPPPAPPHDTVRFGAEVTVRGTAGDDVYRIVGVDEADPARNEVSWLSPIARSLLNARVGEKVSFRSPRGATELEVVSVRY